MTFQSFPLQEITNVSGKIVMLVNKLAYGEKEKPPDSPEELIQLLKDAGAVLSEALVSKKYAEWIEHSDDPSIVSTIAKYYTKVKPEQVPRLFVSECHILVSNIH